MPTYRVPVPVKSVSGTQYWKVTARSPKEALAKFREGDGTIEFEELEVTSLGEPALADVEEITEEEEADG